MEYVNLGKSGLKVSRPFVKKALEAGINFFNTADSQGWTRGGSCGKTRSERFTGRAGLDVAYLEERYQPHPILGHT